MSISLVIPVYNEEHQIKGCLEAIASQSVMPDEVIVVDNNCTDKTIEIAKSFPFVKVIKESKQGRGHARSAGFNVATSEIIGRLDADSRLNSDWVEHVKSRFESDEKLEGLTGLGKTTIIPYINSLTTKLFSRAYFWFVHTSFRTITMWGANMAIRKSSWETVSEKVTNDDSQVHEDQDVSLCIAASGGKILQDNNMIISTYGQRYVYLPKFIEYRKLFLNTKRIHTQNGTLKSENIHKLPLISLLPGYMVGLLLGSVLFLASVIVFPFSVLSSRKIEQ